MSGVDDARRALGARLRELRIAAALSGVGMARLAGWDASKISKIEHGRTTPTEQDLADWCQLTKAELALPDLVATLRNVNAAYLEWKRIAATGHSRRQRQSIEIEAVTKLVRGYDPLICTGLLQTHDYAEAILRRCIAFLAGPDDLAEAVDTRMRRQRVLHEGTRRFHLLIGEPALYTGVGDPDVLIGQLEHLLELMTLTRLVIGIVPATAEFVYTTTNFLMYDRRMVQVETTTAELTITQPQEIHLYERAFNQLAGQASIGDNARAAIHTALRRHRGAPG